MPEAPDLGSFLEGLSGAVIPIAAICLEETFPLRKAPLMTFSQDFQISSALCSTHPGFGKYCLNSW